MPLNKIFVAFLLLAFIGGSLSTVVKYGFLEFPPFTFNFLRFLLASIVLIPIALTNKAPFKKLIGLVPLALLSTGNMFFTMLGLPYTTATTTQLLYSAVPFLSVIMLFIFYNQRATKQQISGLIIGLIGVNVIIILPLLEKGGTPVSLIGNLLVSIAVICWTSYIVFSKKHHITFTPEIITYATVFVTTLFLLPFFLFDLKTHQNVFYHVTIHGILALIFSSLIGTIGNFFLNQYIIRHGGTIYAALAFYLMPIFTFITAFFILGERLSFGLLIGALVVFAGVYITTKNRG